MWHKRDSRDNFGSTVSGIGHKLTLEIAYRLRCCGFVGLSTFAMDCTPLHVLYVLGQ